MLALVQVNDKVEVHALIKNFLAHEKKDRSLSRYFSRVCGAIAGKRHNAAIWMILVAVSSLSVGFFVAFAGHAMRAVTTILMSSTFKVSIALSPH